MLEPFFLNILYDSMNMQRRFIQHRKTRTYRKHYYCRFVALDFTVYNGNINLFAVVKLVYEFPATGILLPGSRIRIRVYWSDPYRPVRKKMISRHYFLNPLGVKHILNNAGVFLPIAVKMH